MRARENSEALSFRAVVNQLGLPLRALVTLGNRFDGPYLPKLIGDLEAEYANS